MGKKVAHVVPICLTAWNWVSLIDACKRCRKLLQTGICLPLPQWPVWVAARIKALPILAIWQAVRISSMA